MKKTMTMLVLALLASMAFGQWGADQPLTTASVNAQTSYNNAWCVAANGSNIHAVWYDDRDGNYEIYYARSTDNGGTWISPCSRLTNNPLRSENPSVAVSGATAHVVWQQAVTGGDGIYYKRSTDGGATWQSEMCLTSGSHAAASPSVTVSGSVVHVVWQDERDGNAEIYYDRSTDGGANWGADSRLTTAGGYSLLPSVAVSGTTVHVVWEDYRSSTADVYYKYSTNAGLAWDTDTCLASGTSVSGHPSVAVANASVHVVWDDNRGVNAEVYHNRSTDNGISWGTNTRLTADDGLLSNYPSIAILGTTAHLVWWDLRDADREIYYKRSTDDGVSWDADTRLTSAAGFSMNPSVATSGATAHVLWHDRRDGGYEIYYKRNPTANPTNVGCTRIWAPTGTTLDMNSVVTPACSVANWGPSTAGYEVRMRIGAGYNYTVSVSGHTSGTRHYVTFPDWTAATPGAFAISCSTEMTGDPSPADDRLTGNVTVVERGWRPDKRLTSYGDSSMTVPPCVAANGHEVHTVWMDKRDGNWEVYYKRSTDNGVNWYPDTRLTTDAAISFAPRVAAWGATVLVVWEDDRDSHHKFEIYYKRSTNGGLDWGSDTRLTSDDDVPSNDPALAVSGGVACVAWSDFRDGDYEIYYNVSFDDGVTWGADYRLTHGASVSRYPAIASAGPGVHVAWQDYRDGNWEVYYRGSTNGGIVWGAETRLTSDAGSSSMPSVATAGSAVCVVWGDDRDGGWEIYQKRSTDNGVTWGADTPLTTDDGYGSSFPDIEVSGMAVHVVWQDNRDGNSEVYYKRSTDAGAIWGADTRLTNDAGQSRAPAVAVWDTSLHVVWTDSRDGNFEIYYKHGSFSTPRLPGWNRLATVPAGYKGKRVKDGGALVYLPAPPTDGKPLAEDGSIYAFKGNNRCEFYEYDIAGNTWSARDSIPAIGVSGKKKAVKKGGALTAVGGRLYATKGNNTLEFWEYNPAAPGYHWTQRANIPTGAKNVKDAVGLVGLQLGDTGFVYLAKASGTQEFYRFNASVNAWYDLPTIPLGPSGKPPKSLVAEANPLPSPGDAAGYTIYALKGTYNELFAYNVDANAWTTKTSLPMIGSSGRKKKVKDGADVASNGYMLYALKGGNTDELYSYNCDFDMWTTMDDIPVTGKRVKNGGALTCAYGSDPTLYALKGNNTLDFFGFTLGLYPTSANRQGVQAAGSSRPTLNDLKVAPNPFAGATTISYGLSKPGSVSLKLYDISGKLVNTLAGGYHPAGSYRTGLSAVGCKLSAGVYLLKFEADGCNTTEKLVIQ